MKLDKPITLVDIETTGVNARFNGITEIGIIKFDGETIIEEYSTLVNPGKKIPPNISLLTGITDGMVEDQPYFEEVADKIAELFKDSYFMAHNVLFDFSFIKRHMEAVGYEFKPRLLCSVKLSRKLYPEAKSHSLENIIRRHNIVTADRHRALDDAKAVYDFMQLAVTDKGVDAVIEALQSQLKYKSLPSNLNIEGIDGIDNSTGVYIFKNELGQPIYVGKSKTLRTRILSHFAQSTRVSKEQKIAAAIHSVETIKTNSELEALLLENKLIKTLLPVFNSRQRRIRKYSVVVRETTEDGYIRFKLYERDLNEIEDYSEVYGVFESRQKAIRTLENFRDEYKLCGKLLGLESFRGPCFMYQLGKCNGACAGKEDSIIYNLRAETAFSGTRLKNWPYEGPVALQLSGNSQLIVDNWLPKYIETLEEQGTSKEIFDDHLFDIDTYKILKRYISAGLLPINQLNA